MLGSPPSEVTQSSHQLARKEEPCHTAGPSFKKTVPFVLWPSHRTCQVDQLEGANHSKLKQLQFRRSRSVSNHLSSLSKLPLQLLLYLTMLKLLTQLPLAVTNTPFNYSTLNMLFQRLPLTSDTLGDHCDRNLERSNFRSFHSSHG